MKPYQRDALVAAFRRRIMSSWKGDNSVPGLGLVPFRHQAEWQLASEGWTLEDRPPISGDYYQPVLIPRTFATPLDSVVCELVVRSTPSVVVNRAIVPRIINGTPGPAHIVADLASFKAGKSFWAALWAAGYAVLPMGRDVGVDFVGSEYSTCEPEFNYLLDFLLSDNGLCLDGGKPPILRNDPTHGRMFVQLSTGAKFGCRSWERRDALKGKKRHAYIFCEAYQLPGFECFTSTSQNLRELDGHALFPTTPDRPWVGYIHDNAHGLKADWHCTCQADAEENVFTFDRQARDRDDPAQNGVMTRERFAISWQGKLGTFIGSVYGIPRGRNTFSPLSHPQMWDPRLIAAIEAENQRALGQ